MITVMSRTQKELLIVIFTAICTTILVWAPFFLHLTSFWGISYPEGGLSTVVRNYDGPNYIVVAKTWYDPKLILQQFSGTLSPLYYTAHYPLFPLFIALLAPLLGFLHALLFIPLVFSAAAACVFYVLLKQVGLQKDALWLSSLFLLFPARFVAVRSVGSPEPLFLTLLFLSLYFFLRKKYGASGVFGGLATLTRSPGILLFVSYVLFFIFQVMKERHLLRPSKWPWKEFLGILIIPLSLLGLFLFYGYKTGDFFAYFHSGDNIHLSFPPFQVFNAAKQWVGEFWLEDIIYVYLFGLLAVFGLYAKKLYPLFFFALVYFLATISVEHRDVARYSIPLFPLLLIGLSEFFSRKLFRWAYLLLLPAVYLYVQNFL